MTVIWHLLLNIVYTYGIDVCPINGNLVAAGGDDKSLKIFDKREAKIVKTYDDLHSSKSSKFLLLHDIHFLSSSSVYLIIWEILYV